MLFIAKLFHLLLVLLVLTATVEAQNNILNNGGFETGLMCYSEYSFSQNPQNFAGDYVFSLSSDAHSGNYSAQISCDGSDCLKANIYSDEIPVGANQAYAISLYAKCPSGTSAFLAVYGGSTGEVDLPLTCNGSWSPNQVTFQTGTTAGYINYALYLFGTSSAEFDDVVLTFGDGTAPQHTVLHSGVRKTSISGQTVNVDGAPFLSLGFYDVGYYDLAQVAATGANTINGSGSSTQPIVITPDKPAISTSPISWG